MQKKELFFFMILLTLFCASAFADPVGYNLINKRFNIDKVLFEKLGVKVVQCTTKSWFKFDELTSDKLGICLYQDFLRKRTTGLENEETELVYTTTADPEILRTAQIRWIPVPRQDNFMRADYGVLKSSYVYWKEFFRLFYRPLNHKIEITFEEPLTLQNGPLRYLQHLLKNKHSITKLGFDHKRVENKNSEWNYFGVLSIYTSNTKIPDYSIELEHNLKLRYIKTGEKFDAHIEGNDLGQDIDEVD